MSDHNSIMWFPLKIKPKLPNTTRYVFNRPMTDSAIRAFGQWISSYDWPEVTEDVDVNVRCGSFYSTLNNAINIYFPVRKVLLHFRDKPWMTGEIKSLIHKRQIAFHQGKGILWKRLRNKVNSSIQKAKVKYYRSCIQKLKKSNPSRWYQEIRILTKGSRQSLNIPVDSVDPSERDKIANAINEHLISVSSDLQPLNLAALPAYLPSRSLPEVYPWQVNTVLSKIKCSTANGPDNISARLIRLFSVELSGPLTYIINASFSRGKVPAFWKCAIVVPIPKVNPARIDKLRPISLTAVA